MTPELLKQIEEEAKKRYPYMQDSPSGAISMVKYNEHQDTARSSYITGASHYADKAEGYKKAAETNYNQVMELATLATDQEAEIAVLKTKAKGLKEALEELDETLDAYWNASLKNDSFVKKITAKQHQAKQALAQHKL